MPSAPVILGASHCDGDVIRVSLTGGRPGATYVVTEYLPGVGFIYLNQLGQFPAAPNADGVTQADVQDPRLYGNDSITAFVVDQQQLSGAAAPHVLRNPTNLTAPELAPTPVWECGQATAIRGHQPGDEVTLLHAPNTVRFVVRSAYSTHDYVPAGTGGPFKAGETLVARYQTCRSAQGATTEVSPLSAPVVVASWIGPTPLSMVRLVPNSLLPGAVRFLVDSVENGASVDLSLTRQGATTSWTEVCAMSPCPVSVPSTLGGLEEADVVQASQRLCGGPSTPALVEVKSCGDVPAPTLASPPRPGDTTVHLDAWTPGSVIFVYVTKDSNPATGLVPIGRSAAAPSISLFRPIEFDDKWLVIGQTNDACSLTHGSAYSVAD
ncbi:MAG: hypothetical protein AB1938_29840 [Myxococcota bacterium]